MVLHKLSLGKITANVFATFKEDSKEIPAHNAQQTANIRKCPFAMSLHILNVLFLSPSLPWENERVNMICRQDSQTEVTLNVYWQTKTGYGQSPKSNLKDLCVVFFSRAYVSAASKLPKTIFFEYFDM